ncbi:hypothetical protein GGI20_003899 [Coemansia sp. BCRC 34301]|nr:hypothetical protein GGI20_003899 [Coemansia sp. BCRC 34301]
MKVDIVYVTLYDISKRLDPVIKPLSRLSTMEDVASAAEEYYLSKQTVANDEEGLVVVLYTGNSFKREKVYNFTEAINGITNFWFACQSARDYKIDQLIAEHGNEIDCSYLI